MQSYSLRFPLVALILFVAGCEFLHSQPIPVAGGPGQRDPLPLIIRHYETGDRPQPEIVKMFEELAASGDPRGTMWIARSYFKGRCSLKEDPERAEEMAKKVLPQIMQSAEAGDVESQFLLASAYQEGLGVDINFAEAAKWYKKCVAAKHVTSLNNFANMVAYGQGIEPDINTARQLFSEAATLGSALAASNLAKFKDDGRDDTRRLADLRTNSLALVLGMHLKDAIGVLHQAGVITDPERFRTNTVNDRVHYHFRIDGVLVSADPAGRIVNVEGHSKGFRGSRQFRGTIPFGLTWEHTRETLRNALGTPDDSGCVASDGAYGMAYRMENVFFAVMFENKDGGKVMLWRVHEKWAAKYPQPSP